MSEGMFNISLAAPDVALKSGFTFTSAPAAIPLSLFKRAVVKSFSERALPATTSTFAFKAVCSPAILEILRAFRVVLFNFI